MKTLYVIAFIIACGISLAAQERVITEAEYTDAISRAEKALYSGTHGPVRLLMETEVITDGRPETDYRLKAVTLIVPGQGSHRVEDRSFGGKPTKTESLTVDGRSFTRNSDGTWKELSVEARVGKVPEKAPANDSQMIEKQRVFKYMGIQTIGDRKVHVYTRSDTRKTVHPTTGSSTESEMLTRVLIGTEGTYLRHESNSKNTFSGKSGHTKIVTEVEADPTIKLTPPDTAK